MLGHVSRQALKHYPKETGGILMGYQLSGEARLVVAAIIGPGPRARHNGASFEPDQAWQLEEVARVYATSGRTYAYLGDWHTHPDGPPTPSDRDARVAKTIAEASQARCPEPLMVIFRCGSRALESVAAIRYRQRRLEPCVVEIC